MTESAAEPALKPLLRRTLEAGYEREQLLAGLSDEAPSEIAERWTAKDHVAHLSSWREFAVRALELSHTASEYPQISSIDEENAHTYAVNRERPAADVLTAARASQAALLAAVEACSEDDLRRPRPEGGTSYWRVIPGNGHAHVAQHLIQWHLEAGDEAAAEEVALWARDLDGLFTDTQSQANAAYNLACFYSRAGRLDDALPLLRRSLEMEPSLRAWARDDPDLLRVRGAPEVQALLAG